MQCCMDFMYKISLYFLIAQKIHQTSKTKVCYCNILSGNEKETYDERRGENNTHTQNNLYVSPFRLRTIDTEQKVNPQSSSAVFLFLPPPLFFSLPSIPRESQNLLRTKSRSASAASLRDNFSRAVTLNARILPTPDGVSGSTEFSKEPEDPLRKRRLSISITGRFV